MGERFNKLKICILITFFISLINPASSQTAEEWVETGLTLGLSDKYDEAIEAYNKAIAIDPNYKEAWLLKGLAFGELSEYDKAIEAYNKAIAIDPNYAYAWNHKGTALTELGEYDKAIEAFNKAIAIDPNYDYAWVTKGVAFGKLGEYDKAIEAYNKAIAIDPNYAYTWNHKGTALAELGEYDKAIEAFNKAIAIDPGYGPAWYNKGNTLAELGESDKAIEAYNKALEAFDEALDIFPNFKEVKEMKELTIKKMAEQTSTSPISNQENAWIIISGIAIFIIISIIALRNRKNKSNIDSLRNPNNTDYKINKWKMFCQKCGAELKEDSSFCSSCGFSLQKEIIKEEKKSVFGQFLELLKLSFKWSGRFNRRQFIFILFGGNLTIFITGIILYIMGLSEKLIFGFVDLGQFLFILVFVGTVVRRLHDMDYSGWYGLLLLIPIVGFVLLMFLLFGKGNKIGETRWG